MSDQETRDFQDGTISGIGRGAYGEFGNMIYRQNQQIERDRQEAERQRLQRLQSQYDLKRRSEQEQAQPGNRPTQSTSGTATDSSASWLNKVLLYAAIVLALVGGGYGFSVTSSLIGAAVGAGLGFAAPHLLRGTIVGTVNFVQEVLPTATKLLLLGGAGFVLYLLLQ